MVIGNDYKKHLIGAEPMSADQDYLETMVRFIVNVVPSVITDADGNVVETVGS